MLDLNILNTDGKRPEESGLKGLLDGVRSWEQVEGLLAVS